MNVCFSFTVNAKGTLYLLWSQVHFSFCAFTTGILTCKMAYKTSNDTSICHVISLSYSRRSKTKYIFGFIIHVIRITWTLSILLVLCLFSFQFLSFFFNLSYSKSKRQHKFRNMLVTRLLHDSLSIRKFFKVLYFCYYSFTFTKVLYKQQKCFKIDFCPVGGYNASDWFSVFKVNANH